MLLPRRPDVLPFAQAIVVDRGRKRRRPCKHGARAALQMSIATLCGTTYTESIYPWRKTLMQSIQVLGPGCPECRQLKADVETALRRLGIAAAVEHVTEISRIIAMDVLLTPALVIDGQVCLVGRHRSIEQLEEILQRYAPIDLAPPRPHEVQNGPSPPDCCFSWPPALPRPIVRHVTAARRETPAEAAPRGPMPWWSTTSAPTCAVPPAGRWRPARARSSPNAFPPKPPTAASSGGRSTTRNRATNISSTDYQLLTGGVVLVRVSRRASPALEGPAGNVEHDRRPKSPRPIPGRSDPQ